MSDDHFKMLGIAIEEDIVDIYRHWHPQSQKYAGGDHLATALYLGWQSKDVVFVERHWHGGSRRINIFHFELVRGDDSRAMAVLGNPYVDRLILEHGLRVVVLSKQTAPLRHRAFRKPSSPSAGANSEAWV